MIASIRLDLLVGRVVNRLLLLLAIVLLECTF